MSDFGVDVVDVKNGNVVLYGRCYQGPLHVGDVFSRVADVSVSVVGDVYGPSEFINSRPIAMKVLAIHSYGREIAELDSGITAALSVEHTSGELPRAGQVIQTTLGGN